MVYFVEAYPLTYALTYKPTIYVSHIRQFWSTSRIETTEEGTKILATVDGVLRTGEVLGTPTEPHHTPSPEVQPSSHTHISSPLLPTFTTIFTAQIPTVTPSETTPLTQYTRRARIAQSSALPPVADEPASPVKDAQEVEINKLKERVKLLEDGKGMAAEGSGDDVPIMGRRLDKEEVATKRVSSDNEEIRLDEGEVAAEKVVPTAAAIAPTNVCISTGSGVVPTEKKLEREAQRMNAQIARDEKITKIHAEEELQQMIAGLDRSNETIAKHLEEYDQAAAELTIKERIELISDLVKYQDHHSKILKYQAQQRKSMTKKQKRDFYMAVIRNNLEEVPEEVKSCDEIPEEKIKELIRLVPIEEVYIEALQVKHPIIDWKVHTEGQRSYWKITRLGGSSVSYQFFVDMLKQIDREDLNQLWALVKETLSIRPAIDEKEMEL
uniref:Uncharacterized protein n=1 Tax=Tanacetum cinerariifolium TaxID=118510 RepID=A0A699GJL1_TANCI|nr:hypothetical protein [Tanacetum cinerariifolium]